MDVKIILKDYIQQKWWIVPSSFPVSAISSFKGVGSKHGVYTVKDGMKKFCESLKEHAMKKTN